MISTVFAQCGLISKLRIKKFHNNSILKHWQGDKNILMECQIGRAFFHTPLFSLNIPHIVKYFVLIIVYLFSVYKYFIHLLIDTVGASFQSVVRMMDDSFIHHKIQNIFPHIWTIHYFLP